LISGSGLLVYTINLKGISRPAKKSINGLGSRAPGKNPPEVTVISKYRNYDYTDFLGEFGISLKMLKNTEMQASS